MIKALLAFTAGAILIGSPVLAQREQTPETAQEFLTVTSRTAAIGFTVLGQGWRNNHSGGRFTGPVGGDLCVTTLNVQQDYEYQGATGRWERTTGALPYGIDWRHVARVERPDYRVILRWTNGITPIALTYPTEELATRAAFAMEFLRRSCDPSDGLAF